MAGLELVVGGAVGAGVIYVWIWRRFQNIRAFFRSRKRVDELEQAFRAAREDMTVPNPYREATLGDDGRTFSQLLRTKIVLPMLHTVGFVHVTDLIVVGSTFDRSTAIRALIDRDREIVALVFATESGVMLEFSSFTEDEVYSTRLGKVVSVADPPSIHRQTLPTPTPADQLIDRHIALTKTATKLLIRLNGPNELVAKLNAVRAAAVRWRSEQSPDDLLDADLRTVLGDAYERAGNVWSRRLRGRLPQATLRR